MIKSLKFSIALLIVSVSLVVNSSHAAECRPPITYQDNDNDGYNDVDSGRTNIDDPVDVFPDDPTEWYDTDKDGVGNNSDPDIDGDLVPNDSDNNNDTIVINGEIYDDGVIDINDPFPYHPNHYLDTDGDCIPNGLDFDDDGDGVNDSVDLFPLDSGEFEDTDGDGIGNNEDRDDDGDGYDDIVDAFPRDEFEWLNTDEALEIANGEELVGNNQDEDDDGDGVLDIDDAFPLNPNESEDYDLDGIGDNSDDDIDGDGYSNGIDAFPFDHTEWLNTDVALPNGDIIGNNADTDDDGDGVLDINDAFPLDPNEYQDYDLDGIGDNADTDDDNDGINDGVDPCPNDALGRLDTDGDSICNYLDPEDDNDGIDDVNDDLPLDPTETVDTDGDGIGDGIDPDIDGDGVLNGVDDLPLDASSSTDTDGDGTGDEFDLDIDGDGVANIEDVFPLDSTEWENSDEADELAKGEPLVGDNADPDDDNDGISDVNDAFPKDPLEWLNTDAAIEIANGEPLVGNNADLDDDGDGVLDTEDAFPLDVNEWSNNDAASELANGELLVGDNADPDDDNDGVIDTEDAFPFDATEWLNTDEALEIAAGLPLVGDNADDDDDGDGVLDADDLFPKDVTEWANNDADLEIAAGEQLVGDNADPDDDNDSFNDLIDAFPLDSNEWLDTDGDTIGNNADTDDDNDGVVDFEDAFPLDANETLDTDGDLLGNNADLDDDGDGMSDEFEILYGFDPLNPDDVTEDSDGDGVNNGTEAINASNPLLDDYPPVISMPNAVNIKAEHIFTTISLTRLIALTDVSASDGLDGDNCCNLQAVGFEEGFKNVSSGVYPIVWRAVDETGNVAELEQHLNIIPLANFGQSKIVAEGSTTRIEVHLSGEAPYYPFEIPIEYDDATSSGKADSLDFNYSETSITITDGTSGYIELEINEDHHDEDDETLLIRFADSVNAGNNSSLTLTITEDNVAPTMQLTVYQQSEKITAIDKTAGEVTVNLDIYDSNLTDTHIIGWTFPDELNAEVGANQLEVYFEPANIELPAALQNLIPITISIVDSGVGELSLTENLYIPLLEPQGRLDITDTDGDGITDDVEGFSDNDGDGIPAFMDISDIDYIQQLHVNAADTKLIETEPGVLIKLGKYARLQYSDGIQLSAQEIAGTLLIVEDELMHVNEYFDFELKNITPVGRSVAIVIPLVSEVPEYATYRKFSNTNGWQDFIEDSNNMIDSVAATRGICPPPESTDYEPGLVTGSNCIRLTIEDGGPNDADGLANGTIDDLGGVATISTTDIAKRTDPTVTSSGSFNVYLLSLLIALFAYKRIVTGVNVKER